MANYFETLGCRILRKANKLSEKSIWDPRMELYNNLLSNEGLAQEQ